MTAAAFFTIFTSLTVVYVIFLRRVLQGLQWLHARKREADHATAGDAHAADHLPVVTVVIAARNEAANIAACITSVRAQDYPHERLHIAVVDDSSTDDTYRIALRACDDDARCTVRRLDAGRAGKKAAITEAVLASESDVILTTDADCQHTPGWVRAMMQPFADGAELVAGPVLYGDRSTLFRRLQALEFLGLVGVGAGLFGVGYPRLCNGANLAYRRARFIEAGGYESDTQASGDDELLMHTIVYRLGAQAEFCPNDEAVVRTAPASSAGAFLRQRTRWAGKGLHYADRGFVLFLLTLFVYVLCCAAAPFVAFLSPAAAMAAVALLLVKFIADARVLFSSAALLRAPIRIADLLMAELVHAPYLVIASVAGAMGLGSWKGRRLKSDAD